MRIIEVEFHKLVSNGNYGNERASAKAVLEYDDDADMAMATMATLKHRVERALGIFSAESRELKRSLDQVKEELEYEREENVRWRLAVEKFFTWLRNHLKVNFEDSARMVDIKVPEDCRETDIDNVDTSWSARIGEGWPHVVAMFVGREINPLTRFKANAVILVCGYGWPVDAVVHLAGYIMFDSLASVLVDLEELTKALHDAEQMEAGQRGSALFMDIPF